LDYRGQDDNILIRCVFQGLRLHLSEIEKLCTEFPSTVVLLDHLAFCKPPTWALL